MPANDLKHVDRYLLAGCSRMNSSGQAISPSKLGEHALLKTTFQPIWSSLND